MADFDNGSAPAEASDDLRADLEKQFETVEVQDNQPAVEDAATIEVEQSLTETQSEGRARNPDGTFAPKNTEAAPEKVEQPATEIPSKDATKASEVAAQPATDAPPAGWTAEAKPEWSKLSPAVKAAVLKREAEIAEGGRQWSDQKRRYEAALTPIAQESQRRGLSTEQGIQRLMDGQRFLETQPEQAIKWLAQKNGIDLATLAGQPADSPREQRQPDISALVREAVAPVLAPIQHRLAMEDQMRFQSNESLVTEFAKSHEHYSAVESDIVDLIPLIQRNNPTMSPQKVLEEAYDRAVYSNPLTRSAIQAANEKAADDKRKAEAAQRVKQARNAAVSVTGAPSGTPALQAHDSLRAELEAQFATAR